MQIILINKSICQRNRHPVVWNLPATRGGARVRLQINQRVVRVELKVFFTVFTVVFLAELGDKTQLATMLFASDREADKLTVFLAASLALILTSALGVIAGALLSEYINEKYLAYIAGVGFIAIGVYTVYQA